MKKTLTILACLFTMLVAGTDLNAQEVSIAIMPGWTWIGLPGTQVQDLTTVFTSFSPMEGDIIISQNAMAEYDGVEWFGNLGQLDLGYGYMYYSNRDVPVMITFNVQQPAPQVLVTTSEPTNITGIRAEVGGTVAIGNSNHVFVSGICWSTEEMPTVDDNHKSDELNATSFCVRLYGLVPNTTYYTRAYAVTDYGLVYGNQQSFTTSDWNSPTGAIDGLYSVSASQQVYFSQGNLQYQASTNTWHFADNQYDCLGNANRNISSSYDGWIDLFGWGTSSYDHGANCYMPWNTNQSSNDYYAYGEYTYNLSDQNGQADWGYNPINNGGCRVNQWRTLTRQEWDYVFNTRTTTSGIRYARANVNGVNGLILLPDDWVSGTYSLNNTNSNSVSFSSNILTASQWTILENAGAIFLPAAGYRFGGSVGNIGFYGCYWSATYCNNNYAFVIYFNNSDFSTNSCCNRSYGQAVRLVCPVE